MANGGKTQFITTYKFNKDTSKPNRVLESVKVGEIYVSRLTVKPGFVAGNLYHKEINLILFVTKGKANIKCVQVETKEEVEMECEPSFGIIHQPPFTAMALKNNSLEDVVAVIFSNKRLRGDDDFVYHVYE